MEILDAVQFTLISTDFRVLISMNNGIVWSEQMIIVILVMEILIRVLIQLTFQCVVKIISLILK